MDIVCDSPIDSAVTFDIPNPFKIRSQNGNSRLNILDKEANEKLIKLSALYSNIIYDKIRKREGTQFANNVVITIVNGTWDSEEIDLFLSKLNYRPDKIAIGGLSSTSINGDILVDYLKNIRMFNFEDASQIHFLGCGGFKKQTP